VLAELEPEFDAHWRGLDLAEQKTLRAVVAGRLAVQGARRTRRAFSSAST